MSPGPSPGEITLSWSGSGSTFDVYRGTWPATLFDPLHRLGTTAGHQWPDAPPDARIVFYEVMSTAINRIAAGPLKPYVFLALDTSGSMASPTGSGPPDCAGVVDTRLNHAKCAIDAIADDYGGAVLGLGRFRQATSGTSCSACTITGIDCGVCDTSTGSGCTSTMSSDARLEILAPLSDGGHADVLRWNDFTCGTCGTDVTLDPEIAVVGYTPTAGLLKGIRSYFEGLQAEDGTTLWPSGQAGFDPIRKDPLATAFLPGGEQCRPYIVMLLTDGDETCATFDATTAAAAALLTTGVDGRTYRIETKAIGFGLTPGYIPLENIAHAGGAPDVVGANEAFYPRDAESLQQTLARIIDGVTRFETCNDVDDDCDGLVDEDFPDKGRFCDDGRLGVCRGTGVSVCRPDGTGTQCQVTSPGGSPLPELCNGRDDNCDGAVDEGCGSCVQTEVCGNGVDDNCNGQVDEGCSSCVDWVDVGGGAGIMKYEASKPDATPASVGSLTGAVCSRPGVQPWTNVTEPQAAAACATIGARLCTEQEWQRACAAVAPVTYPIVEAATGDAPIYLEAEAFLANTPAATVDGVTRAWVPDSTAGYSGISALRTSPDTGANVTAANAPAQSPRLDFEISFSQTGNHYVWVRMFAPNALGDTIRLGLGATPGATPSQTLQAGAANSWLWMRTGAINVATTGLRFLSLYMAEDGAKVDSIYVTRNGTTTPTLTTAHGGHWAFASNADTFAAATCNGRDLDTDQDTAGNQDQILTTGEVPGGQCYANLGGGRQVFDLSGNVKEWTAPRLPGVDPLHGGASDSEAEGISCEASVVADDGYFSPQVGFRCCR